MKEINPTLNTEPYLKTLDKIKEFYKDKYDIENPIFNTELNEEILNEFFYTLIMIYLKKKYELSYPFFIEFLIAHYNTINYTEIINLFNDLCNKNEINDIINNFIFEDPFYNNEKYKAIDYFQKNNKSFCDNLKIFNYLVFKTKNFKDYIKYLRPLLKGYVYYDDDK